MPTFNVIVPEGRLSSACATRVTTLEQCLPLKCRVAHKTHA